MTKYNSPNDTNIFSIVQALEDRIERLERAPRAIATSIDTGAFVLKNPTTGHTVMYVGTLTNGDYGVEIYRDDGTIAFRVGRAFISDPAQIVRLYNRSGLTTAGDQFLDPNGMYNFTTWPNILASADPTFNTSSGTFVDAFLARGISAGTVVQATVLVSCSDGTTSGEMRLVDPFNTPLTGFFGVALTPVPIPLLSTSPAFFDVMPDAQSAFYANFTRPLTAKLQVRRTAGAGSITLSQCVFGNKTA